MMQHIFTLDGYGVTIDKLKNMTSENYLNFIYLYRPAAAVEIAEFAANSADIRSISVEDYPCGYDYIQSVIQKLPKLETESIIQIAIEAYTENHEKEFSSDVSYYTLIADIMTENTGINISYQAGNSESALMLISQVPWKYNEDEQYLTKTKLDEIFSKYLGELKIKLKCPADYITIEFC